jgi:hypothetical protein
MVANPSNSTFPTGGISATNAAPFVEVQLFRLRALLRVLKELTDDGRDVPGAVKPRQGIVDVVTNDVVLFPVTTWQGDQIDESTALRWLDLAAAEDVEALLAQQGVSMSTPARDHTLSPTSPPDVGLTPRRIIEISGSANNSPRTKVTYDAATDIQVLLGEDGNRCQTQDQVAIGRARLFRRLRAIADGETQYRKDLAAEAKERAMDAQGETVPASRYWGLLGGPNSMALYSDNTRLQTDVQLWITKNLRSPIIRHIIREHFLWTVVGSIFYELVVRLTQDDDPTEENMARGLFKTTTEEAVDAALLAWSREQARLDGSGGDDGGDAAPCVLSHRQQQTARRGAEQVKRDLQRETRRRSRSSRGSIPTVDDDYGNSGDDQEESAAVGRGLTVEQETVRCRVPTVAATSLAAMRYFIADVIDVALPKALEWESERQAKASAIKSKLAADRKTAIERALFFAALSPTLKKQIDLAERTETIKRKGVLIAAYQELDRVIRQYGVLVIMAKHITIDTNFSELRSVPRFVKIRPFGMTLDDFVDRFSGDEAPPAEIHEQDIAGVPALSAAAHSAVQPMPTPVRRTSSSHGGGSTAHASPELHASPATLAAAIDSSIGQSPLALESTGRRLTTSEVPMDGFASPASPPLLSDLAASRSDRRGTQHHRVSFAGAVVNLSRGGDDHSSTATASPASPMLTTIPSAVIVQNGDAAVRAPCASSPTRLQRAVKVVSSRQSIASMLWASAVGNDDDDEQDEDIPALNQSMSQSMESPTRRSASGSPRRVTSVPASPMARPTQAASPSADRRAARLSLGILEDGHASTGSLSGWQSEENAPFHANADAASSKSASHRAVPPQLPHSSPRAKLSGIIRKHGINAKVTDDDTSSWSHVFRVPVPGNTANGGTPLTPPTILSGAATAPLHGVSMRSSSLWAVGAVKQQSRSQRMSTLADSFCDVVTAVDLQARFAAQFTSAASPLGDGWSALNAEADLVAGLIRSFMERRATASREKQQALAAGRKLFRPAPTCVVVGQGGAAATTDAGVALSLGEQIMKRKNSPPHSAPRPYPPLGKDLVLRLPPRPPRVETSPRPQRPPRRPATGGTRYDFVPLNPAYFETDTLPSPYEGDGTPREQQGARPLELMELPASVACFENTINGLDSDDEDGGGNAVATSTDEDEADFTVPPLAVGDDLAVTSASLRPDSTPHFTPQAFNPSTGRRSEDSPLAGTTGSASIPLAFTHKSSRAVFFDMLPPTSQHGRFTSRGSSSARMTSLPMVPSGSRLSFVAVASFSNRKDSSTPEQALLKSTSGRSPSVTAGSVPSLADVRAARRRSQAASMAKNNFMKTVGVVRSAVHELSVRGEVRRQRARRTSTEMRTIIGVTGLELAAMVALPMVDAIAREQHMEVKEDGSLAPVARVDEALAAAEAKAKKEAEAVMVAASVERLKQREAQRELHRRAAAARRRQETTSTIRSPREVKKNGGAVDVKDLQLPLDTSHLQQFAAVHASVPSATAPTAADRSASRKPVSEPHSSDFNGAVRVPSKALPVQRRWSVATADPFGKPAALQTSEAVDDAAKRAVAMVMELDEHLARTSGQRPASPPSEQQRRAPRSIPQSARKPPIVPSYDPRRSSAQRQRTHARLAATIANPPFVIDAATTGCSPYMSNV